MSSIIRCCCRNLDDLAIIAMGDPDGLDDRVFSTLDQVCEHGGIQWWLYASTCIACGQSWMVAQDDRIHDNFLLKRIDAGVMCDIVQGARWPGDFLRFEQVLRLERQSGKIATYLDPRDSALVDTARELRCESPDISVKDIAFVLAIPVKSAARLLKV